MKQFAELFDFRMSHKLKEKKICLCLVFLMNLLNIMTT